MSVYTDWLADRNAERIVLLELTRADGTVYRFATQTFVTSPNDTPANTVYHGRLAGGITIRRRLSGPMEFLGGASVAQGIVIANHDGAYDAFTGYAWESAAIYFGDPSWTAATIRSIGKRGTWRVVGMEADDIAVRPELADRYDDLAPPMQAIRQHRGPEFGNLRPMSYGYPKNCTVLYDKASNAQQFLGGEEATVEDPAVTHYINQLLDATAVAKGDHIFSFNISNPEGRVTADIKGMRGGDPDHWLYKLGESLVHALTRTTDHLYGFATGGSFDTIQLGSGAEVSRVDDFYNGSGIGRGKPNDADSSKFEGGINIADYDGETRIATLATPMTLANEAGDGYRLGDNSAPILQLGPLVEDDLDLDAFDALDTALPYEIGMFIHKGESSAEVLDEALAPGGYHYWTTEDKLTVGLLTDPSGETPALSLTSDDLQDTPDAIRLIDSIPPAWSIKVGYDRNYTPEKNSATLGALDGLRSQFVTREHLWARWGDGEILTNDRKAREAEVPTFYTEFASAQAELTRLRPLLSVRRGIYGIRALADAMAVPLADTIEITDPRHGFDAGKKLALFGITETLPIGHTELECWG